MKNIRAYNKAEIKIDPPGNIVEHSLDTNIESTCPDTIHYDTEKNDEH